ncbi:MAG: C40 family peptidase [Phycisphaerales bacterium]|nr:MAG: C40 family peptidase [Phycisphaerales bacterium]
MTTGQRAGCVLIVALATDVALAEPPPYLMRQDIINYAATAIESPYVWGGGCWDPNDRDWGGADCSGLVCKSWSLEKWTPYDDDNHGPYATWHFAYQTSGDYYEVDRSELLRGDAIVYRYWDDNAQEEKGHTYIYLSGDGWGVHEVYEARGPSYGIVHRWCSVPSGTIITKGIRRARLMELVDVTEHITETDDGFPYYTDSGMTGSSPADSYAPGCREGDCRYRWVTPVRNETCTYQPDLPVTGWYRIYVTCNEDSPNVQGVGVTVNHELGSDSFVWDQNSQADLNTWVPMGSRSFLFNAGTEGTVVWDDFNATPTDGNHAFRGDATKFSLDNRVEVDGTGGEPGKFASIRDALDWLRTHESEEPDVINVSCDALVERGCIELNLLDDLTVNGDADGNGIPVTIVVTPGVPSDWSRPCAMYLDIPIQHDYALRDIVLVPQYVSAGHATGAYGIVIDEQNPSSEACAMSLMLENVTVAGSLPGNVPTDPRVDARALATMFGGTDGDYGASVLQRTSDWGGADGCRQTVTATDLTVTHGATRGLALRSSYTDWDVRGGLLITYSGLEGIKADHLGGSTLTVRELPGCNSNRIAGNLGGGAFNAGDAGVGHVSLSNCIVTDNEGDQGGGVTSEYATTIVKNSIIVGNVSTGQGGAISAVGGAVTVANCTIANNTAAGGAGGVHSSLAGLTISDSILWGNSAGQIDGVATVSYSDVQGGYEGAGNIDRDPMFLDPDNGDYHVAPCSPVVNAGDPGYTPDPSETDIDGDDRVIGDAVDMGADEVTEPCLAGIPTVSEWGLAVMTLLVLSAGTVVLMRSRAGYVHREWQRCR